MRPTQLALDTLRAHQAAMRDLADKHTDLMQKVADANALVAQVASDHDELDQMDAELDSLRGRAFIGQNVSEALATMEASRLQVASKLKASSKRAEGAAAGAVILQQQADAVMGEITALSRDTPALQYNFAIEQVNELMAGYREAAVELGKHFAKWQAFGLIADSLMDVSASPRRPPILGTPADSFSIRVPMHLQDMADQFEINLGPDIQQALTEARALIEGE